MEGIYRLAPKLEGLHINQASLAETQGDELGYGDALGEIIGCDRANSVDTLFSDEMLAEFRGAPICVEPSEQIVDLSDHTSGEPPSMWVGQAVLAIATDRKPANS